MKINHLFPLAVLLAAGWLPALTPNQSAWQRTTAKVNGTLNATGSLAKQPAGSDTGKVNALATHLEQLAERFDAMQLAFNEAMQDASLSGEAKTAYLTRAGQDLNAINTEYATVRGDIATNYAAVLGGDYLVSTSDALGARLSLFLDSYAVQSLEGGGTPFWNPCAHQEWSGGVS